MTVCVTGGAGFIGRWLVRALLARGDEVTVLDDLSNGGIAPPQTRGLRFVHGSVLDPTAIDAATRGADMLIHLAGVVGMRLARAERQRALRVSVEGTELLLARMPTIPAVLTSSSAVYGLNSATAFEESVGSAEERTLEYDGGLVGYATGKWRMEAIGRRADRPILCVRPFNIVGPGQSSAWGMVLPSFLERACAGEELTVYDDGRQSRCFGFVGTFVDTPMRAMAVPAAWELPDRALNIGSATRTSILDLASLVLARTGSTSTIAHLPYESAFPGCRDLAARIPDTARLESLIGPVAWPSIEEIVDIVVEEKRR